MFSLQLCFKHKLKKEDMKIAIESPETLSVEDLENIVDVWSRKQEEFVFNAFCFIVAS